MKQCCKTCKHFKVEMVPWTESAMGECSQKSYGVITTSGRRSLFIYNAPGWGTSCPTYAEKPVEEQLAETLAGVWSIEGHEWVETDRTHIVFKTEYMNAPKVEDNH